MTNDATDLGRPGPPGHLGIDLSSAQGRGTQDRPLCGGDARGGVVLGEIRWYAPWHTYVFRPRPETIWEAVCLSEVGQALAVLTTAYKRKGVV